MSCRPSCRRCVPCRRTLSDAVERPWLALVTFAALSAARRQAGPRCEVSFAGPLAQVRSGLAELSQQRVVSHAGHPCRLDAAAADIARGYVDVARPTVLSVRNNSDDGSLVACDADPTLVSRLTLGGLPRCLTELGPTGGFRVQPGYFRQETTFELHWRICASPRTPRPARTYGR